VSAGATPEFGAATLEVPKEQFTIAAVAVDSPAVLSSVPCFGRTVIRNHSSLRCPVRGQLEIKEKKDK
jgi:hypothetical protein